jgi:hypothetical protein
LETTFDLLNPLCQLDKVNKIKNLNIKYLLKKQTLSKGQIGMPHLLAFSKGSIKHRFVC